MRPISMQQKIALFCILIVVAACNTAPTPTPGSTPIRPSPSASPTQLPPTNTAIPPTATVTPIPSPTPEPPPPAGDALEQLLREVEAGRYTLEEGLVQSLTAMLTGSTLPLDETQPVIHPHLTTLIRHADDYIENGSDEATKAKLTELLRKLFPTEADLDAVSRPESSSRVPRGLAAQLPVEIPPGCTLEGQCLIYREIFIAGSRFKIYYPAIPGSLSGRWWESKLDPALQSVTDSARYYNAMGRGNMRSVIVIFRPDGDAHLRDSDYAITRFTAVRDGSACPIIINPTVATIPATEFQQVLAHELFHCYQAQIFQAQTLNPYPANLWWVEGTAEHFSGLVYPGVRFEESAWVNVFDLKVELRTSLVHMKYETIVFFNYLHNTIGRSRILDLIASMPTSGGIQQQIQRLSAFSGMQDLWHHFAQAYYDRNIPRASGGGLLPVHPPEAQLIGIGGGTTNNFLAEHPFTIYPYRVLFNTGQGIETQYNTSGVEGRESAQPIGSRIWTGLPNVLGKDCSPREYLLLVTTTNGEDMPHSFDARSTQTDEASCTKDRCLIGKWQVVPNIFWLQFSQLGQDPNAAIYRIYEATEGTMYLTFTQEGRFTMQFEQLTAIMADRVENILGQNVTAKMKGIINGGGSSDYFIQQPGVLGFRNGSGEGLTFTFEVNNMTVSNQHISFPGGAAGGTVYYRCTENTLYYDPFTPNGGAGIWPWQFTRVSGP